MINRSHDLAGEKLLRVSRRFAYFAVLLVASASSVSAQTVQTWAATWIASPVAPDADPEDPLLAIDGQTVRQRARISIGGARVRVALSNEFGTTPLVVASATLAPSRDPASVEPGSVKALTFSGRSSVSIPPGAPVLSDPVDLPLASGSEIAISLYFPQRVLTPTTHSLALKRAVISTRGDFTRAEKIEPKANSESSISLSAILVPHRSKQRVVVAFGDSLTDGDGSSAELDRNWPSTLARRLNRRADEPGIAVVNAGIAGNRLLADGFGIRSLGVSGLARFDRDVLTVPGATHVVVLEGINDLGFPAAEIHGQPLARPGETRTPEDLIAGYRQLIARGHARGLKVIGATMTPFEGVDVPGYYSPSKEQARQTVNRWIRTSKEFDSVLDFDAVVRDPSHPSRMQSRYSSPDHLHPSDIGYEAIAESIDPTVFQ